MENTQVLVVEDNAIVAMDIRAKLERLGYSVPDVVGSGEEAVARAAEIGPDLILMDIKLSGEMDGIGAAEHIQSRCAIPVVYLTAHADGDTLRRAKLTEPFGYVVKPFEKKELHAAVEMALNRHRIEGALKHSKQQVATALRFVSDAAIAADGSRVVTFINPIASMLTGWSQADALGEDLTEVFNVGEERDAADDPVETALKKGGFGLANGRKLVGKNGVETSIDYSAAPIESETGTVTVTGVVVVFREAGDRRRD